MKAKLKGLIRDISKYKVQGGLDVDISGISDDSRKVEKGFLFVAVKGTNINGHDFIAQAISNGAVAVVCEYVPKGTDVSKATIITVASSRQVLGLIASAWYSYPSKRLRIIGVTGTDGKTTTSTLIYWILKKSGKKVGLVSTVGAKVGSKEYDTGFHVTSPDPLALHGFLAKMVRERCEYAVLEVTSHGLDQGRVVGVDFDIGVLTNITHEHLDYHKTYESYVRAKAKLFVSCQVAVINKGDKSYKRVKRIIKKGVEVREYNDKTVSGSLRKVINLRFPEVYNQLNVTAAIVAVRGIVDDRDMLSKAITSFAGIAGRMEEIKNNKGIRTIVDFAHTPNALKEVLLSLNKSKGKGKLIAVFGSAGERDTKKRRLMPEVSTSLADFSVFTAEDPRSENIEDILRDMEEGAKNKNYICIPERGEAIHYAINKIARRGDTVVVCGKGHEKSMAYAGIEYPWSDQEAVKMAMSGKVKKIPRP